MKKFWIIISSVFVLLTISICLILILNNKTYIVSFDTNGGSLVLPIEVKKNEILTKPSDPSKFGYEFNGWLLNGTPYDFNQKIVENIILVAEWEYIGPTELSVPTNVKIKDNTLTWDQVNNATGYEVYIDDLAFTTSSNSFTYDFSKLPYTVVMVAAKYSDKVFEKSSPIINEIEYSAYEIYEILSGTVGTDVINNKYELYNTFAQLVKKYNVNIEDIMNLSKDTLVDYLQDHSLTDLFSLYVIMFNNLIKTDIYEITLPNKEELDENINPMLQDMMNNEVFESNNLEENYDKFVYFISPYFMNVYEISSFETHDIIKEIIHSGFSNIEISKIENTYRFVNLSLNKEFVFSFEELDRVCDYLNSLTDKHVIQEISFICSHYIEQLISYNSYQELLNIAEKSSVNLITKSDINKTALDKIFTDLLDATDIVVGYEEKISKLINDFKLADNNQKINSVIEDAKNFTEQVFDLIEDTLPIEQEVEELLKFVKEISSLALYFDSYLLVDFHEHLYNLDTLVKLTNDALNDAVFLINQSLDIINVLTEDDIFKIMELITSFKGTVSNEVIDIVKKVFDYYVDIIIDFEFRDGMINEDTLEILNDVYYYIVRSDLLSFIKFYTGQDIHQQDIDLFLNEIYLFIDYLFKYNFDTLIELLCSQKVTCSYVKDLNTEIFKLSNYVLDYIDNSLLEKYKVYIIDILDYNNIDVDFYQKIYDNLDGFKTYASLEFINYLNMNLCYTIGLSSYDQFLAYFNVYSKLTNEEISNATLAYVDYEKYINKRMEDEFTNLLEHEYMTNFEACMDDIESLLGTMPSSLTQKDADKIVLYNTFTLVNNNYWKFPGVVDIVLDDEREQLIVTISDGYPEYYMFDTSYSSRIEINFVLANFHIANYYFDFNVVDNTLVIDYKKIQDFVDYYQTDCIKAYINRATIGYYAGDFVTSFDDSICGYDLTSILYK